MALAVPGNHDVTVSPDALARAVERTARSTLISQRRLDACPDVAVSRHRLRSGGGQTCDAISLPPGGRQLRRTVSNLASATTRHSAHITDYWRRRFGQICRWLRSDRLFLGAHRRDLCTVSCECVVHFEVFG